MTTPVDYLYQLLAAFEADEVSLKFDPVFQLEANQLKLHGLRSVVDWPLESRNHVASIFKEAERFGMSLAVDEPSIRLLFRYLKNFKSVFEHPIQLYVSVCITSFTTDTLVRLITDLADDIEFDLSNLTLCLKENYPNKDYLAQLYHLNELKGLNVKISVTHSENNPPRVDLMTKAQVNFIELSRELVLNYKSNRQISQYLKGMIATIRNLNKSVYVDGVSDLEMINFFRACGAEYFSGSVVSDTVNVCDLSKINRSLDTAMQSVARN